MAYTLLQTQIDQALLAFEAACRNSNHELCDGSRICESGLNAWRGSRDELKANGEFDIGRDIINFANDLPYDDWPTTRLIGIVRFHLLTTPTVRGHWRATVITTALGRLAERGVPVDGLVRRCIGPSLIRRILITTDNILMAIRENEIQRGKFDYIEAWFKLLEAQEGDSSSGTDECILGRAVVNSRIRDIANDWISRASMTHIIGWRLDDFLPVNPSSDSLSLPAGMGPLYWVYDRSTITYIEDWRPGSRDWEQAWINDRQRVMDEIEISPMILSGRIVSQSELVRAISRSVLSGSGEPMVDEMDTRDIFETLISMINSGALRSARDLAGRAHYKYPQDEKFRLMFAFCNIPLNPEVANDLLDASKFKSAENGVAAAIDRVCVRVYLGLPADLEEACAVLNGTDLDSSEKLWLWDPRALAQNPRMIYVSARDWMSLIAETSFL